MIDEPSFDSLADLYDRFQAWNRRLPREVPWLARTLRAAGAETVLDAACGTGAHLEALAAEGFSVAGSDLSSEMIARARERLGPDVVLEAAGFTEVPDRFSPRDAVIVVGNSLPNAGSREAVSASVAGLARAVRPGGVLVLHLMNFPLLVAKGGGSRPVRHVREGGVEHLFVKLFEVHEERVVLDVISLSRREEGGEWRERLTRSILWPVPPDWLKEEVRAAGLAVERVTEGFSERPFDPAASGDLVLTASRPR